MDAGTYEQIHDFADTGEQDFTGELSADELASTSVQVDWYTRETETDTWQLMGGSGAEAVESYGIFHFKRFRYVKKITTVTGSDLPIGVIGGGM